jgi:hypothetical protein
MAASDIDSDAAIRVWFSGSEGINPVEPSPTSSSDFFRVQILFDIAHHAYSDWDKVAVGKILNRSDNRVSTRVLSKKELEENI